ncbi:T5orf172 domain-containing protein [Streptosporangium subroseum]|uniref:T5orf172 domain-containing protein n=2 Tax=Streptosporangium subroseum TaxID=106412 RepID=A0A239AN06_9ACTN|nr:T5orf172 domain-containing protein [Streptosporangium subroseum]
MAYRFNSPPGWPVPPESWRPPKGWQPDPSWPPAPLGWEFWVAAHEPPAPPAPQVLPQSTPAPVLPERSGGGLFGGKKKLEAENAELRAWVERLGGMDAMRVSAMTGALHAEHRGLQTAIADATRRLHEIEQQIVQTEEIALLQEVGVYEYRHPLSDAVAYKDRLAQVKTRIKAMSKDNEAVLGSTGWQVNGSAAEGRRMVRDFSKLMLRAYNAEADNCVRTMRPYKLQSAVDRLEKAVEMIVKLGKTMSIHVSGDYHRLRIYELELTADYLAKQEEEKELIRAQREQQREEEAARREFEREKTRLRKEEAHYRSALSKLLAKGDEAGAEELKAKLEEIGAAVSDVEAREANIRAGYVYVISNVGAFGENVVKIGMTRRLEPEDRVRELGDASVPFRFDTHALIFSDDAVGLEGRLHALLNDQRVNKVNHRREFFHTTPAEVRDLLEKVAGQHLLEYRDTPEALEWRQSVHAKPAAV